MSTTQLEGNYVGRLSVHAARSFLERRYIQEIQSPVRGRLQSPQAASRFSASNLVGATGRSATLVRQ